MRRFIILSITSLLFGVNTLSSANVNNDSISRECVMRVVASFFVKKVCLVAGGSFVLCVPRSDYSTQQEDNYY
jgi:hypothetical protein